MITPIAPNCINPNSRTFDPAARCDYYSNVQGHNIYDCLTLKEAIEEIIQEKRIIVQEGIDPDVTDNPLPTHENVHFIEMICDVKEYEDSSKSFGKLAAMKSQISLVVNIAGSDGHVLNPIGMVECPGDVKEQICG